MDFAKRPMKGMIYVDAGGTDSDEALEAWLDLALGHVKTLPAKPLKEVAPRKVSKQAKR
jgi:hypothetical protein